MHRKSKSKSKSGLGERESSELAKLIKGESKDYRSIQQSEEPLSSEDKDTYMHGQKKDKDTYMHGQKNKPQDFLSMYKAEISQEEPQSIERSLAFINYRLGNITNLYEQAPRFGSDLELERIKELQYGGGSAEGAMRGWGIGEIAKGKSSFGGGEFTKDYQRIQKLQGFKEKVDKYYDEAVSKYGTEDKLLKSIESGGPSSSIYLRFIHMLHHLLERTEGLEVSYTPPEYKGPTNKPKG